MKYDFTSIIDRVGKDALAVEDIPFQDAEVAEGFSRIPMWVADMNFATVPVIQEHIIARAGHPTFGYYNITDAYYNSIIDWHRDRNGVTGLSKEHIGYLAPALENCLTGCIFRTDSMAEAISATIADPEVRRDLIGLLKNQDI